MFLAWPNNCGGALAGLAAFRKCRPKLENWARNWVVARFFSQIANMERLRRIFGSSIWQI